MKKLTQTILVSTCITTQILGSIQAALAIEEGETPANHILDFSSVIQNEGEAIEGGTLRYAVVSDEPFTGAFNDMFDTSESDSLIMSFISPDLYGYDENFVIDDSGFAKVRLDADKLTASITIPEGHTWHDGEPITIDDVIIPYYMIGHPDYSGIRYGYEFQNVVGMDEYHEGKTDTIEGLERVHDHTLVIHYKEFSNSALQANGMVSSFIQPNHIFKDIPVAELEDSEYVHGNPVGFGPFKVESFTPGESVTLTAFDDYYKGRPKIDYLQLDTVSSATIVQELKNGNYDIADLPTDQYDLFKDASNFQVAGNLANVYTYIGFKMGHWDDELEENIYDETLPVSNRELRRAMAHAVDNNAIGSQFYSGLRHQANSFITPNFADYYNPDQPYPEYDPELAKSILEEAGFVDVDGDGFVEDPEGQPLKLNFGFQAGGEVAEPIATYYIQCWRDIGIDIELVDGKLLEMNSFYERLRGDDPEFNVYQAAFGLGGDPNPGEFFGRQEFWNYTRWTDEKNDELIERINSKEAYDFDFRKQAYYDWQAYMMEELPAIPTLFRYNLTAVNNRVSHWDINNIQDIDWTQVQLLADTPIKQ